MLGNRRERQNGVTFVEKQPKVSKLTVFCIYILGIVSETPKRKRKPRTMEPKKPVEPKKPTEAKKSGKSTKLKEKQEKITDTFKVKRKVDRFNGVSEAELLTKTLPDILTFNLDIVIVRICSHLVLYIA